jgi:DNA-binding CsgD family transcriptional regulator
VPLLRRNDEGGVLVNKRIESILSRLTKPVRGAVWTLGVFDLGGDLLDFAVSSSQIDRSRSLELLCAAPVPASPKGVKLQVTGENGKVAANLFASTMLDATRYLVLVLVRSQTSDAAWLKISQNLKSAIARVAGALATEPAPNIEGRRAFAPPQSDDSAFFMLTSQLQVAFASQPEKTASPAFVKIVAAHRGRLPTLLERAVRRLTKSWDFARIESCSPGIAYPIPGLALRVEPMTGTGVMVGVFLKLDTDRHPVTDAAAAYRLSPREREVLHALLDGHSVADIAAKLELAESTVSDHIARMIVKTNAHNRVEMAAMLLGWPALRSQFLSPGPPRNGSVTNPLANSEETNGHVSERTSGRVSWRYKIRSAH